MRYKPRPMIECIEIDYYHPRPDLIRGCAQALKAGQLVACPTDTAYGVFVSIEHEAAIKRLGRLREQMSGSDSAILAVHEKPLAMVFPNFDVLKDYVVLSGVAFKLVKQLLPGPFTIVLPAQRNVPKRLQSKRRYIGVRIPDYPIVQALIGALGVPVLSTTAKTSAGDLIEDAITMTEHWEHEIDKVIDAEPIDAEPSTVLAFEKDDFVVIREGRGAERLNAL